MFKHIITTLMITTLLFSQGVSALVIGCDMDKMLNSDTNMLQLHVSHESMQHESMQHESETSNIAKMQPHNMQSNQDCCDTSCECEHGTAFSAALFVANSFPESLIQQSNINSDQFSALDAHSSDLIKPPII